MDRISASLGRITEREEELTEVESSCEACKDEPTDAAATDEAEGLFEEQKRLKEYEYQRKESDLEDSRQGRKQRKEYAEKIFMLVCAWLAALFVLVAFVGNSKLEVSDNVLLGLITGTSVNVIGLMAIVATHIFPKNGSSNSEK